jgi:hypothetical protein
MNHLSKVYANFGGHPVIIHNPRIEFVESFPADIDPTDILAGAMWVEDPRNAEFFSDLAHTEEIEGVEYDVTYGINASRSVTETVKEPEAAPKDKEGKAKAKK